MANSRSIEIRDAITAYLNTQSFELNVTAKSTVMSMVRQENLTQLTAFVAPQTITPEDSTRAVWDMTYEMAITTVMPLTTVNQSEEDDLIAVVEQIQMALMGESMAGAAFITNESSQALFEEADFGNSSLFVGTVVMTYLDRYER